MNKILEEILKEKNPCWVGYEQYGTKNKNGKKVPNCIPEEDDLDERLNFKGVGKYVRDSIRGWSYDDVKKEVAKIPMDKLKSYIGKVQPKSAKRTMTPKEFKFYELALKRINNEKID